MNKSCWKSHCGERTVIRCNLYSTIWFSKFVIHPYFEWGEDFYGYVSYNTWTRISFGWWWLELCFPRTQVNAMLPNAIYRILDSTRTEYVIWKYTVAKNGNVLFEFTISSLKYVYILFDRDAALMPVPQKSRTSRAGWSRCPSSFWPGECTRQGVALCIGWGFAYVCWWM